MTNPELNWLDNKTAEVVTAFATGIKTLLGPNIESLALTGSVLTRDFRPGVSDINSVLVLKSIDAEALAQLASLGKIHGKRGLQAPLILTPEIIATSLDVFPIEFLNIKLLHRTILGTEAFGDLMIDNSLLRLQLERELKARLINLRQGYLKAGTDTQALTHLLLQANKGFFPLFRAYLVISGQPEPPATRTEIVESVRRISGLETACFEAASSLALQRKPKLKAAPAHELFMSLYETTNALAAQIDRAHA